MAWRHHHHRHHHSRHHLFRSPFGSSHSGTCHFAATPPVSSSPDAIAIASQHPADKMSSEDSTSVGSSDTDDELEQPALRGLPYYQRRPIDDAVAILDWMFQGRALTEAFEPLKTIPALKRIDGLALLWAATAYKAWYDEVLPNPASRRCVRQSLRRQRLPPWRLARSDYPTQAEHPNQPPPSPACPTQAEQGRDRRPLPLPGCQTQAHQR